MLQKLKNKLRLVKDRWLNLGKVKRFLLISMIVAICIGIQGIIVEETELVKEENYSAMHELIQIMIKEKSTDVKFDTSRISYYSVDNKAEGTKKITIYGKGMERINLELSGDYQIKELSIQGKVWSWFEFWLLYAIFVFAIGCIITVILFAVFVLIKKIVKFFEE